MSRRNEGIVLSMHEADRYVIVFEGIDGIDRIPGITIHHAAHDGGRSCQPSGKMKLQLQLPFQDRDKFCISTVIDDEGDPGMVLQGVDLYCTSHGFSMQAKGDVTAISFICVMNQGNEIPGFLQRERTGNMPVISMPSLIKEDAVEPILPE